MRRFRTARAVLTFGLLVAGAACGARDAAGPGAPAIPQVAVAPHAATPIRHVVVIVQENRSFDNLFRGFPGADTVNSGSGHGKTFALKPVPLEDPNDIEHSHVQFLVDYDAKKMDGFDTELRRFDAKCADRRNDPKCWIFYTGAYYRQHAYAYVPRTEIAPYWALAQRFALSDRTFVSSNGPSYPSHQILISGQSAHVVENPHGAPWGCDGYASGDYTWKLAYGSTKPPYFPATTGVETLGPFPCFSNRSIADVLDAAGVSWTYYAPSFGQQGYIWSPFDALWPVRFGADWSRNVASPESRIFDDIASGTLAQVVWVAPSWINSDHAGSYGNYGPDWVGDVVNAIGESPYWNDTAILLLWDDWGGWYDHVPPPQIADKQTGAYEGLGFRVPLIAISPYAKPGFVSHAQHETAATLRYIEATFGLPSLGGDDARADALGDLFDYAQSPVPYQPVKTRFDHRFFASQRPASRPPDD